MITINPNILSNAKRKHVDLLGKEIKLKRDILNLSISFMELNVSSVEDLKEEFGFIQGNFHTKLTGINLFLKNKISKYEEFPRFFEFENRDFEFDQPRIRELNTIIEYFTNNRIDSILGSKPDRLLEAEMIDFENLCKRNYYTDVSLRKSVVNYLFNYDSFSSISKKYDAYQLTKNLQSDTCLYCNRNYTLTVERKENEKIIRPELDHFFPQHSYPLFAVSFYNLIPSCHICNSNLKGSEEFDLKDYYHPYLGSFDDHAVKFTYRPLNAMAFFDGLDDGLMIKLNTKSVSSPFKERIEKNIEVFKLNNIYTYHEPLIKQLQELKRLSNSNYLDWISKKVFVDEDGNSLLTNEKEVYEVVMLNFYNSVDYSKRPMAKFMKDIAVELGIIP